MTLRAYRRVSILAEGDGVTTTLTFDLRDVAMQGSFEGAGFTLESPPSDVAIAYSYPAASITNHTRFSVTLEFVSPPTSDGASVALNLFYEV
jgi:hypothetical protein